MEFPHISFNPPMYKQRYERVTEILQKLIQDQTNSTVMEVGCAELGLHNYLKKLTSISKIIYLDLDEFMLERCKTRLRPTTKEYLHPRSYKLTAEIFAGCVTKPDPYIINARPDALIAIELIEHLDPHILIGFEISVFQKIRPKIVIVTTPNYEYNVLFDLNGNFRHWDHRFEWTRSEFKSWCQRISEAYGYEFKTDGVGGDSERYGFVTQIAIFEMKNDSNVAINWNEIADTVYEPYKLIARVSYPWDSVESKILKIMKDYVKNLKPGEVEVTLSQIMEIMPEDVKSLGELSDVLENDGYDLRNNKTGEVCVMVRIPEPSSADSEWVA